MNNDLISRSALKKAFDSWKNMDDYYHDTDCNDIPFSEAYDLIDNAPTVPLPDFKDGYKQAILDGKTNFSRPQGEWKREDIEYAIETSDCTFHNGKTYYEKEDLMKSMEDLGLFEDEKGEEE